MAAPLQGTKGHILNDLSHALSSSSTRSQQLSEAITLAGVVWRGGPLTDGPHVRASLAAMCSGGFDKRFLEAAAAEVADLAKGHATSAQGSPAGDWVLDDAVWKFAVSRKYVYIEMVESISGHFVSQV